MRIVNQKLADPTNQIKTFFRGNRWSDLSSTITPATRIIWLSTFKTTRRETTWFSIWASMGSFRSRSWRWMNRLMAFNLISHVPFLIFQLISSFALPENHNDLNFKYSTVKTSVDICRFSEGVATNWFYKVLLDLLFSSQVGEPFSCPTIIVKSFLLQRKCNYKIIFNFFRERPSWPIAMCQASKYRTWSPRQNLN